MELIFDGIGALLAFARLFEPYVYQVFKSEVKIIFIKIYHLLGCKGRVKCQERVDKIRNEKFHRKPLSSFVNSTFNIEFVYLILLSINTFMERRQFKFIRRRTFKEEGIQKEWDMCDDKMRYNG